MNQNQSTGTTTTIVNNYNQPNQVNINPNENKILSNSEKNNEQNGNNIQNSEFIIIFMNNLNF